LFRNLQPPPLVLLPHQVPLSQQLLLSSPCSSECSSINANT
jgi:hypothetical protein